MKHPGFKREHIIVEELIIKESRSIKEAMQQIDRSGYGIVFVVDSKNRLIGSLTDGDIRRAILSGRLISEKVEILMNRDPLLIREEWDNVQIEIFLQSPRVKRKGLRYHVIIPVVNKENTIVDMLSVFEDESNFLKTTIKQKRGIKRILVIGGAGYIGSTLVRLLRKRGYAVSILDTFLYDSNSLKDVENDNAIKVIKGDTRHIEDIIEAMQDVDAVVHLAELVGDSACANNPRQTLQINYLATKLIASLCKYFQINRLIYASSCSVYGASTSDELLYEASSLNPVSLYATMKAESEKALFEMMDDNFSPTILRLATVYGASYRPRFDLVVNSLTVKALMKREISIFNGFQWRPHVHVEDAGRAIIAVLEAPLEHVRGEIFNVGSNKQNHTIAEVGSRIVKIIPGVRVNTYNNEEDKRNYRIDFSKIASRLNFEARKRLEDGIKEIIELMGSGMVKDYQAQRFYNTPIDK